jgi:hypothetical protein
MADHVQCIGGVARLCADPLAELDRMRGLTQADEFAEWLEAYESGHLVIVALDLFADVGDGARTTRRYGASVSTLSFLVPHGADNVEHAREVVRSGVESLAGPLGVSAESLLALPLELDPGLAARLHGVV